MASIDEKQIEENSRDLGVTSTGEGHHDPNGTFPRPDYYNSSNVAYEATGSRRNELNLGGSVEGIELPAPSTDRSVYPYNQTQITQSGHSIEMDDTPGAQRILIRHKTFAKLPDSLQQQFELVTRNRKKGSYRSSR